MWMHYNLLQEKCIQRGKCGYQFTYIDDKWTIWGEYEQVEMVELINGKVAKQWVIIEPLISFQILSSLFINL